MRKQLLPQPDFIPVFNDYNFFSHKKIGITGSSGILGSILKSRIESHRLAVCCYEDDITNDCALENWFRNNQFDYVFHFAAVVPLPEVQKNPLRAFDVNAIGTYYLCKQLVASQPRCRVFIASSSHVYKSQDCLLCEDSKTEPISVYGQTKLLAEQLAKPVLELFNVSYAIGRIFSFTHINQKEPYLVPTLRAKIERAKQNDAIEIANPDSVRDIMDAETVIDCILHIVTGAFNGIVNIGTGCGLSIKEIAEHQAQLAGKKLLITGHNKNCPDTLVADVSILKNCLSERQKNEDRLDCDSNL